MFCGLCLRMLDPQRVDPEEDGCGTPSPVSRRRCSEKTSPGSGVDAEPCAHPSRWPLEEFAATVRERNIPIVIFSDSACEQMVWNDGRVIDGRVECPSTTPDVWSKDAVVMSP